MTALTDQRLFYMIARTPTGPHSTTTPTTRYATAEDALAAARKLAESTGRSFVLLGVLATIQPADTRTDSLFDRATP